MKYTLFFISFLLCSIANAQSRKMEKRINQMQENSKEAWAELNKTGVREESLSTIRINSAGAMWLKNLNGSGWTDNKTIKTELNTLMPQYILLEIMKDCPKGSLSKTLNTIESYIKSSASKGKKIAFDCKVLNMNLGTQKDYQYFVLEDSFETKGVWKKNRVTIKADSITIDEDGSRCIHGSKSILSGIYKLMNNEQGKDVYKIVSEKLVSEKVLTEDESDFIDLFYVADIYQLEMSGDGTFVMKPSSIDLIEFTDSSFYNNTILPNGTAVKEFYTQEFEDTYGLNQLFEFGSGIHGENYYNFYKVRKRKKEIYKLFSPDRVFTVYAIRDKSYNPTEVHIKSVPVQDKKSHKRVNRKMKSPKGLEYSLYRDIMPEILMQMVEIQYEPSLEELMEMTNITE